MPRNQSSTNDTNKSTEGQQTVSVQNNLPNPDAQNSGSNGTSTSHQEESTNFEIGKTVRTIIRDTPSIKRVSMAVLVDGITERGADGKPTWRELTKPERASIEALVRSAIGYDQQRRRPCRGREHEVLCSARRSRCGGNRTPALVATREVGAALADHHRRARFGDPVRSWRGGSPARPQARHGIARHPAGARGTRDTARLTRAEPSGAAIRRISGAAEPRG